MTLYVVRHAHAGERLSWEDDDGKRPLSTRGWEQAEAIARRLAPLVEDDVAPILLTSPASRCQQTLAPLAATLGREVTVDTRVAEGAGRAEVEEVLEEIRAADVPVIVCTHGDVIPLILTRLNELGMQTDRALVWQKASIWSIERTDRGWGYGSYAPPPGELV